jgi:hypothetical protein
MADDNNNETKRILGAVTGGAAGVIGGGKVGIWLALAMSPIPVVGPALATAVLVGIPVTGGILGAKAGRNNPAGGVFSLLMSGFIPSGSGGGPEGVPDALT